ncbi:MAG: TIGR03435 family protein [Candidatus Acidiferrales bacterium]
MTTVKLAGIVALIGLMLPSTMRSRAQSQGQTSAAAGPKYEYEVASIKPYKPDPSGHVMSGMSRPAHGLLYTNFTLEALLRDAFGVQDNQISGLPAWARSEGYVIDARMDASTADALKKLSESDLYRARQQMLQALLADRFGLAVHRESRELPVYSLVIAKGGFKLNPTPPEKVSQGGSGGSVGWSQSGRGGGKITGQAIPIVALTESLTQILGRTVLDKTGLRDFYDVTLQWAISDSGQAPVVDSGGGAPSSEPAGPTIFIAIQEQLGLKLESGKGPVEIIVIDHVEKPSGN